MKFEYYQESSTTDLLGWGSPTAGQWRWRLKAANGENIAYGESYTSKQNCLHAILLLIGANMHTPIILVNH